MGLLKYLGIFWAISYCYHKFIMPKRLQLRRKLKHLRKHLRDRIRLDSDILPDDKLETLEDCKRLAEELLKDKQADPKEMKKFIKGAERKYEKIYPPKHMAWIGETVELLVVVFGVVMGIRALFFQPFKIPTGSMQPTLFGIHFEQDPDLEKPNALAAFFDSLNYSYDYTDLVVEEDGMLKEIDSAPFRIGPFTLSKTTRVRIGNVWYRFPGGLDTLHKINVKFERLNQNSTERPQIAFTKGEVLARGKFIQGDHIMVDRLTYRFRDPQRGEIIVFETSKIPANMRGFHYIKRLVGMPGDILKIEGGKLYVKEKDSDEFVVVDGKFDEAFDRIYSGKGGYHGYLAHGLLEEGLEKKLGPDDFFVLGDNSASSYDGRAWGVVPRGSIIGRAFLIWWPFSRRWGLPDSTEPWDFPTDDCEKNFIPGMCHENAAAPENEN